MTRKIYVASSWRNTIQPHIVAALLQAGHEVYDFRNPTPDNHGFHWSEIDPEWRQWRPEEFVNALNHPVAIKGFDFDFQAMQWADTGILVLPCGRSAHFEAGYFRGVGKDLFILMLTQEEPELMYRLATGVATSLKELLPML